MRTVVLNAGSSSLKTSLFDGERRVGRYEDGPPLAITEKIDAVGHRIVHGGPKLRESVIVNDEVMRSIVEAREFAPLHNDVGLKGIETARELFPDAVQVACFDTSFHRTIPEVAAVYGLPYELQRDQHIRRYGFHGLSHQFAATRAGELLRKPVEKLITCHLGSGASICAIRNGDSVDTSMGFTPLEGLLMGTRCGDLDPGVVLQLLRKHQDVETVLSKESGLQGLSGISSDMREVERAAQQGNKRARLAFDVFCYRVKKYIGSYAAALDGVDAIVFTGGIGEHSSGVRATVLEGLGYLGVEMDKRANARNATSIHAEGTRVACLVVPAEEDLVIAREVIRLTA
jgi:acetate kinase